MIARVLAAGALVAVAAAQGPTEADARAARDRALAFLVSTQRDDGGFSRLTLEQIHEETYSVETFHAWGVAAHALACEALLRAPESPERGVALERGLRWFADCRTPLRGSDWDNDAVWPWLYGVVLGTAVAADERFAGTELGADVGTKARVFLDALVRNQVPTGGFGYYDDPPYTRRPKWATSFCTALVLPALEKAMSLGWLADPGVAARARRYVLDCRLPNGAFAYDLRPVPRSFAGESIDTVKGALGRIQVCHWALTEVGDASVSVDDLRRGLGLFFAHHEFLATARMRPIPHEGHYANAGYFFLFGHEYAGRAIEALPEAERAAWRQKFWAELLPTQRASGAFCDFLGSRYTVVAGTAMAALGLGAGLDG